MRCSITHPPQSCDWSRPGKLARNLIRGVALMTAVAVALPSQTFAQPKPAPAVQAGATEFNLEQLDAMLAPIALYPDELLTQTLMASTYPLQVIAASRWLQKGNNKDLKGDALAKALESESWDPSVKSLVPFPQVIALMNDNLEWTQQLGYAVATQQPAVLDSIQRLRRQAQKTGSLKTTEQQRVVVEKDTVVIQPADPQTVYVPTYQPAEVYGEWPYPSYPPVYLPPPPAYYPPGYVHQRWSNDEWLRADRLARLLWCIRYHDLHRQPGRHRLPEGSRTAYGGDRGGDEAVRSGP